MAEPTTVAGAAASGVAVGFLIFIIFLWLAMAALAIFLIIFWILMIIDVTKRKFKNKTSN